MGFERWCVMGMVLLTLLVMAGCGEEGEEFAPARLPPAPCVEGDACDHRRLSEQEIKIIGRVHASIADVEGGEAAALDTSDAAYIAYMDALVAVIQGIEGTGEVTHEGRYITFTTSEGGYSHKIHVGMGERPSPSGAAALRAPPDDLEPRLMAMARDMNTRRQALVAQGKVERDAEKKEALTVYPWDWYYGATNNSGVGAAVTGYRDYTSGDRKRFLEDVRVGSAYPIAAGGRADIQPELRGFMDWALRSFVYVRTHGSRLDLTLSTGVIIGREPTGMARKRRGYSCEEFYSTPSFHIPGMTCQLFQRVTIQGEDGGEESRDYDLYVLAVNRLFLETFGSSLSKSRTLLELEACSILEHPETKSLDAFLGERSVLISSDNSISAGDDTAGSLAFDLAYTARWELVRDGNVMATDQEFYAIARHTEAIDRLDVYLTDSQESFTGGDGELEVNISLVGFDGREGRYEGGAKVALEFQDRVLGIRCVATKGVVNLTRFEDAEHLTGTFASGEDVVCTQGTNRPNIVFRGQFKIDLP